MFVLVVILIVIVVVLVVVLTAVAILIVLVVVLVLIFVLIVHISYLLNLWVVPKVGCPKFQDLSFALKRRLTSKPTIIAAVIPPAVAFSPPVSTPMKPLSAIASLTPLESVYPNPVNGTVAPAPAKSISGS